MCAAYNKLVMTKKDIYEWLLPLVRMWGLADALREQEPVLFWKKVVGEKLGHLARPLYVERRTLHLAVPSPVVAAELRLLQDQLLARLKEIVPNCQVQKLRFHVRAESETERFSLPKEVVAVKPTKEDVAAAERDVPHSLPSPLRERFVRIAAWAHARDRAILAAGGGLCPSCGAAFLGEGDLCPICSLL